MSPFHSPALCYSAASFANRYIAIQKECGTGGTPDHCKDFDAKCACEDKKFLMGVACCLEEKCTMDQTKGTTDTIPLFLSLGDKLTHFFSQMSSSSPRSSAAVLVSMTCLTSPLAAAAPVETRPLPLLPLPPLRRRPLLPPALHRHPAALRPVGQRRSTPRMRPSLRLSVPLLLLSSHKLFFFYGFTAKNGMEAFLVNVMHSTRYTHNNNIE